VSVLAVAAAAVAHLVADGHAAGPRQVVVVGALLVLVDVLVAPWARGPWALALRLGSMQVAVHVTLSVGAIATAAGDGTASGAAHHGAVATSAAPTVTWADVVPSAAMVLAHLLVAVLVAALVTAGARSSRTPGAVRAAVAGLRAVAVAFAAAPLVSPPPSAAGADPGRRALEVPPPRAVGHRWLAPALGRRGPPAALVA
jgi:hypothetical protein